LAADALARTVAEAETQHWRHVTLTGRWLPASSVFLDNRPMNGRVGFHVLTPLALASGDAVLVLRGWAPRDFQDRGKLPALPASLGTVTVSGLIAPPPSRLYDFGSPGTGRLRQNLDLDAYAREIGIALRPVVLQQQASDVDDGLQRQWPAPAVDIHKHYGYAFQWFALAALLIGLYVWFQVLGPRRSARHDAAA
jgi:surfeit locus 1 family protein